MSIRTTIICDLCRNEIEDNGIHVPESLSEARRGSMRDVLVPKGDYHLSCLTEALKPKTAIEYTMVCKKDSPPAPPIDEIEAKVIDVIKGLVGDDVPVYPISKIDDLDLDSLDHIDIIMTIEDKLKVELSDEDLEHVSLVGDVIQLVKLAMEEKK